jgi:beta-glucosidase
VVEDHLAAGRLSTRTLDFVRPGDLAAIATPTDFLGVNYYSRGIIRSDRIPESQNAPRAVHAEPERTDMDWEVYANGLTDLLLRLHRDYQPPRLYITENGAAYATGPDADGRVRDTKRVHYLRTHLEASLNAIEQGVPLGGYFAWSLLDNFEWAFGYQKRFGLVFVDYATQKRIPKDSAHLYRAVVARNSLDVEMAA